MARTSNLPRGADSFCVAPSPPSCPPVTQSVDQNPAVRLLLINPNISESVSALIADEARRTASPGTSIDVITAPFGMAYIETRFEALIGAYAVAQLAAEHYSKADAIVVAAFGDPGLPAIRELVPIPVVGMSEAALSSACLLGQRFSIIAISSRITAWYRETVERCEIGRAHV